MSLFERKSFGWQGDMFGISHSFELDNNVSKSGDTILLTAQEARLAAEEILRVSMSRGIGLIRCHGHDPENYCLELHGGHHVHRLAAIMQAVAERRAVSAVDIAMLAKDYFSYTAATALLASAGYKSDPVAMAWVPRVATTTHPAQVDVAPGTVGAAS